MDIDFAFICDYAEVAGKIYAVGIGIDTLFVPQLPGTHRGFYLVVQMRASIVEAGQKDIAVRLIDGDGSNVIEPLTGQFVIPMTEGRLESIGRIALGLQNLQFQRLGPHSIHVLVQGEEKVRIPFTVAIPPSTTV